MRQSITTIGDLIMNRKTMKLPEATHRELKIQAAKAGLSMIDYLEFLLRREESKNEER